MNLQYSDYGIPRMAGQSTWYLSLTPGLVAGVALSTVAVLSILVLRKRRIRR